MPTTNPIPSYDPTDLLFNAAKLDEVVNSTTNTYYDRLGVQRRTLVGLESEFPNAQANATAAAASATAAAASATQAANEADSALDEATAAQASRVAAETARDAAMLSAGVYATTAAGLAATTSGKYFSVPSASNTESLILYQNSNGTAVEVKRYPSTAGAFAFRGQVASGTDLNNLKELGSYGLLAGNTYTNLPAAQAGRNCTLTVIDSFTPGGRFQIQHIVDWNSPGRQFTRVSDGASSSAWEQIPAGAVGTSQLADGAVTNLKLANNYDYTATLTSGSLDTYLVTGGYVIAGTITNAPTASGFLSVHRWGGSGQFVLQRYVDLTSPGKIYFRVYSGGVWSAWSQPTPVDASITAAKLAASAVTTDKLADSSITTAKIADGSVVASKLPAGVIDPTKLSAKYDWVATITSGDVNDYTTQTGGWMVAGAMTNAPTGSGWLFVHKFGAAGNFILQRWHDFTDPSIFWVRKNYNNTWSAWAKTVQPQVLPKTGKNIVCLGDSITENGDYPARLATLTGATVTNCGFGGSRLAFSTGDYAYLSFHKLADYISSGNYTDLIAACDRLAGAPVYDDNRAIAARLAAVNWSAVDYIVAAYGTNDYGSPDVPLGVATDTTGASFRGAINYAVNKICTAYPHIKILFVSPIWRARYDSVGDGKDSDTYANSRGATLIDFVDAMKEMAALNKMPCIDMYRTSGINKYTGSTLLSDGLHPTAGIGYQRIAEKVAAGLNANW